MEEQLAKEISEFCVTTNASLAQLSSKLKENYPQEIYAPYFEKFAHISALSFDVSDMITEEYSHINPYDD